MNRQIVASSAIIIKGKTNNGDLSKSYFKYIDYKGNNDPVLYIRTIVLAPVDNIYNDFDIIFKRWGICLMERKYSIKHDTLFKGISKLNDELIKNNL